MNAQHIPTCLMQQFAFCAIRAYAAHSYLYYQKDSPIISDTSFDQICSWLMQNWDWVKPHDINNYLDYDSLIAGTGYNLDVTGQTRDYALFLLEKFNQQNNADDLV